MKLEAWSEWMHWNQRNWCRSAKTSLGEIVQNVFEYKAGKSMKYQGQVYVGEDTSRTTIEWKSGFRSLRAAQKWCDDVFFAAIRAAVVELRAIKR